MSWCVQKNDFRWCTFAYRIKTKTKNLYKILFCRWCSEQRWHRERQHVGEEIGEPDTPGRDHPRVPARLSRGGVLRQPHVPRPGRLSPQVRQLVLAVALQDSVLPGVLHAMNVTKHASEFRIVVVVLWCDRSGGAVVVSWIFTNLQVGKEEGGVGGG